MLEEIALLAVTKMLSGFCIAGVRLRDGAWVRPVKEYGTLVLGDISYANRQHMAVGDVATLNLLKPRPQQPHVEDWTCDFVRQRPRRVGPLVPAQRAALLSDHCEPSPGAVLFEDKRSLCLIKPAEVRASFSIDGYSGKYECRIWFPDSPDRRGLPCTDLKWRSLGRHLLGERSGSISLEVGSILAQLGASEIYLAIGLARAFEGRHWPLVIGVHTVPEYETQVDFNNP